MPLHPIRRQVTTRLALAVAGTFALPILPVAAQQPTYPTAFSPAIAARADVKAAIGHLERGFPKQVDEWIRIAEMQGKSGHEAERGAYVRAEMEKAGLEVSTDSIGNVTGRWKGTGGGPTIVLAAHLDIVHPLGTNLKVRREGDTLRAPGIFDNSASVANMLAVIRAMKAANLRTRGDILFVATVQEEAGLFGMDWWLEHNPRPDMLVAMDGGLGPIAYGALGIYWTKYHFSSEGSHTFTSRGKPTPVRALAQAIERIYAIDPPPLPDGAVYNIGQVHGGEIFNGIPQELYFTVDLRSPDPSLLDSLDAQIGRIVADAADKARVKWRREVVTRNGAGGTARMLAGARAHPLVQSAIDIHRFLGIDIGAPGEETRVAGSTDANMGVVRKIPSISVGRSFGGNQHTLSEWAHWPSALPASKMVLLLALSMTDGTGRGATVIP